MNITFKEILIEYDGPILVVAKDDLKNDYICICIQRKSEKYFCIQVKKNDLNRFLKSKVDLRTLYKSAQSYFITKTLNQCEGLYKLINVKPKEDWFPLEGAFLDENI